MTGSAQRRLLVFIFPLSFFFEGWNIYPFFLGWQTRGEKALLQGGEIGLRIATKAQLAPTTLVAIVELLTQCLPGGDIREPQVSSRETTESRGTRSHHAYRATHH